MLSPMSTPEFATLSSDDLVTGEAVALDLPPASVAARIGSGLLDVATMAVVAFSVLFLLLVASTGADDALQHVALICSLIVVFLVYPTTVETLTRGKSLGKLVLGLRVVRDDGGTVTAHQAFVRALVAIPEIYALSGGPAFFCCLVSPRGKRLGDYAAGTYVVRERVKMTLPPPPMMPPHLAAWAAGADIARLPDGLAMAVRQFLMRAPLLSPQSRATLGIQLCDEVSAFVAPQPPVGTHPEVVLAAVIADRRRRDAIRLERDAALRRRLLPIDPLAPPP